MRSVLPLLILAALTAPARAGTRPPYPPPGAPTGRLILRLNETLPPPRLFRISEELEGQYRKGGRRSPYLLVQPRSRRAFKVPPEIKNLVAFVEPEIYMYTRPVAVRVHRSGPSLPGAGRASALGIARRGIIRPSIGKPASGSRKGGSFNLQIPSRPSTPNDPHFNYQWGFQEVNFGVRVPSARRYSKGAGVTVGVVDSGVRQSLSDFAGTSFLPPYNAITTRLGGVDDNGHGSHVAGTIAPQAQPAASISAPSSPATPLSAGAPSATPGAPAQTFPYRQVKRPEEVGALPFITGL